MLARETAKTTNTSSKKKTAQVVPYFFIYLHRSGMPIVEL
jgi:hypothetical protein